MGTTRIALLSSLVLCGCGAVAETQKDAAPIDLAEGDPVLVVTKDGTGGGTVVSAPAGIDCGATCEHAFARGTSVTLTATAAGDSAFTGWTGDCSGASTCTVNLVAMASVGATFTKNTRALTVALQGVGTGTVTSAPTGISCGSTCTADFALGSTVTLTAASVSGSVFGGWGGACTGAQLTCAVAMTDAKNVTAAFHPAYCATGNLDQFNIPDTTTIPGWTERLGNWAVAGNAVRQDATGGVYTHYMVKDNSTQGDGCSSVTAKQTAGGSGAIQAVGVVLRWTSPDNYVVGLVQDNGGDTQFNTLYIYQYPGGGQLGTLTAQNLGKTPRVKMCITGTTVTLSADAANDGTFESVATGTTTLTAAGGSGVMTHTFNTQATADDYCVGQ